MTREKMAERLLREAMHAINDELNAAGIDEVRQHPTLRKHAQVAKQIEKFLRDAYADSASVKHP